MFKYLSLVVYLLVILAVSGSSTSQKRSRFNYLKGQSDNVGVITYLYIVFLVTSTSVIYF